MLRMPCPPQRFHLPPSSRSPERQSEEKSADPVPPDGGVVEVTVTALVSARPLLLVTITRYVPAVVPAVYTWLDASVPPVAPQVTVGFDWVVPLLIVALTENCAVAPAATVTLAG